MNKFTHKYCEQNKHHNFSNGGFNIDFIINVTFLLLLIKSTNATENVQADNSTCKEKPEDNFDTIFLLSLFGYKWNILAMILVKIE